jgi:ADP-ribosyl-[dinitrogen reductase] hydrolase
MTQSSKFKNISACILGVAIGDALGVPVEFKSRMHLTETPITGMQGFGTWNQPPGTWLDDTSLTLCLVESMISGYKIEDIGSKFQAWMNSGHWTANGKAFDVGQTTKIAINRLAYGVHPHFAGEKHEHSNGNGSLMRIAPGGLFFNSETDSSLFDKVSELSAITHAHFESIFSCFIL